MSRVPQHFGMFAQVAEVDAYRCATKIHVSEWAGGAIWSDEAEQAFESFVDFVKWYSVAGRQLPSYAWECESVRADSVTAARRAVEFILRDENGFDPDSRDRLLKYIERWVKNQDVKFFVWGRGARRVVLLGDYTPGR